MLKHFKEENTSNYKSDNTIVTSIDIEINSYLIQQVKTKYPNHSIDG